MIDINANESSAIEFRNVSLSFDGKPALVNASFQLGRGEMIVITGVSGSGKSALLHLAAGLLKPDTGQIFVEGREVEILDEPDLLRIRSDRMGIVFQEDSLFTGMTVYENAAYRLEEHGWTEEQIDKAVREVLKFVGLDGEVEKFPEELSSGMKRRLEIARALIGWPSIMLYDEPTMGLDPIVAVQILDLLIRARDINKISSLYVTKKVHELPYLASYYASETGDGILIKEATPDQFSRTKVIVLEHGKIVFAGSVEKFQHTDLSAIKQMIALDQHNHASDPYFPDPWDKKRRPKEEIL
jgi:phospholipid/cholesterol/gamma-HCH transport system ATP-binding protein